MRDALPWHLIGGREVVGDGYEAVLVFKNRKDKNFARLTVANVSDTAARLW
jgi:hypothetical protein